MLEVAAAAAAAATAAAQKCGPESVSACVAPSVEHQPHRPTDEFRALRPTGTQEHSIHSSDVLEDRRGSRSSCRVDAQLGDNTTGRAHQANQGQTDGQTDGRRQLQDRCPSWRLRTTPTPAVLLHCIDARPECERERDDQVLRDYSQLSTFSKVYKAFDRQKWLTFTVRFWKTSVQANKSITMNFIHHKYST